MKLQYSFLHVLFVESRRGFLRRKSRWARSLEAPTSVFALGLLLAFPAGCSHSESAGSGSDKIRIVATTGIVADLATTIGGDRVSVAALMGPGVDPHLYKASAGDVQRLSSAQIILYSGLHLEAKMGDVLGQMGGRIKTVAVAQAIDPSLLQSPPEFKGAHDPHVWFDVALWKVAAGAVRDALVEFDAAGAEVYRANAQRYLQEMDALDAYVRTRSSEVPPERRVLITAHDAFHYFGRAYGFEVRGLQGISTESKAGTADVRNLAEFIAERRIPAIFVESSVPAQAIEAVQAAVRSRGFDVAIGGQLFSDALGNPGTSEGTYLGMVRHNIDTIVEGLKREVPAIDSK